MKYSTCLIMEERLAIWIKIITKIFVSMRQLNRNHLKKSDVQLPLDQRKLKYARKKMIVKMLVKSIMKVGIQRFECMADVPIHVHFCLLRKQANLLIQMELPLHVYGSDLKKLSR